MTNPIALVPHVGSYDLGTRPVFTATFTDAAGVLTDPSTVLFLLRRDGVAGVTTYTSGVSSEVANPSVGVFTFTPPVFTAAGRYRLRAKGTAGLLTAGEATFDILPSGFPSP